MLPGIIVRDEGLAPFNAAPCHVYLTGIQAAGGRVGPAVKLNVEEIAPRLEALFGVNVLPADVYYIASMPSDLRVPDVVRVTLLAFGLCVLATLYPSWRAARTQPAEALRYDH